MMDPNFDPSYTFGNSPAAINLEHMLWKMGEPGLKIRARVSKFLAYYRRGIKTITANVADEDIRLAKAFLNAWKDQSFESLERADRASPIPDNVKNHLKNLYHAAYKEALHLLDEELRRSKRRDRLPSNGY